MADGHWSYYDGRWSYYVGSRLITMPKAHEHSHNAYYARGLYKSPLRSVMHFSESTHVIRTAF